MNENEMKILKQLGQVPQDMLDDLAQWQENRTPLSEEPDIRMQAAAKQQASAEDFGVPERKRGGIRRILPLSLGVCAAAAACLIVAVSIGKDAFRNPQLQAGFSDEGSIETENPEAEQDSAPALESEEQITESAPEESEPPFTVTEEGIPVMWADYFDTDIDIPEGGLFKTVCTAEDAQYYLDLPGKRPDNVTEAWHNVISGEYDIILLGFSSSDAPMGAASFAFHDGTLTPDGSLSVDLSVFTNVWLSGRMAYENYYMMLMVPDGSLPEITDWQVTFDNFRAHLPMNLQAADSEEDAAKYTLDMLMNGQYEYFPNSQLYQEFIASAIGGKQIRFVSSEADPNTVPVNDCALTYTVFDIPEASAVLLHSADELDALRQDSGNPDLASMVKQLDWHDTYSKEAGEWDASEEDCLLIMAPLSGDCMTALSDIHISEEGVVSAKIHYLKYNDLLNGKELPTPPPEMKSAVFTVFVPKNAITTGITGTQLLQGDYGVTTDNMSDAYEQFYGICSQKQTITLD